MKLTQSDFYKELLCNFVKVSICQSFTFGLFENLHPEYTAEYEISYLEKVVKKMAYVQGDYSKFLAGKAHELSVEEWEENYEEEYEEYRADMLKAVQTFFSLLNIPELDIEKCFAAYVEINEGDLDIEKDFEDEEIDKTGM